MGRRPKLLERKDMHAKVQHVRKRRANFPAAQSEDQTVLAMIGRGKATAPQSVQGLNRMMNGRDPVNAAWLTLLSQVYDLPTIRAEDWYELSDADFFRKVDLHICHDPIDVLMALAEERADLRLEILRTSPLWRDRPPPAAEAYTSTAERSMEVGTPRYRRRLIETVAPGDGIRLLAGMPEGSSVEVVNVDGPEGDTPSIHVMTGLLDIPAGQPDPRGIGLASGGPIPVGSAYVGRSRCFFISTTPPAEARWQPKSDGWIHVADLRDFVIHLVSRPVAGRQVFAADYRTVVLAP